jgi:hypothetical protein
LRYRKVGQTWHTAYPSQSDCDPDRLYIAQFSVQEGTDYEFKISTKIDGVTYWSDLMTRRSGRCDDNPPIPKLTATAEELKHPFVRAFPNPFNPTTTLVYNVPSSADVVLTIYAADGSFVKTLVSRKKDGGVYTIDWDGVSQAGNQVASGIYFVKLKVGSEVLTSKIVLLK